MTDQSATDERQAKLDEQTRRFEERMALDEEKNRPKRSRSEVLDAAVGAVKEQLASERAKLEGRFSMAAQEKAQKEKVSDLEWLVTDLERLRDEG